MIRSRLRMARSLLRRARTERPPEHRLPETLRSVAIIMDGNGRWAAERGRPVGAGHRAGAQALKRIVRHASDLGLQNLTVYSFSTENWSRPQGEVQGLMALFVELIDREIDELHAERVRMRFIGRRDELSDELQERIRYAEEHTAANRGLTFFIAMNYGGRREILDAARRFAAEHGPQGEERDFARCLYGPDMIDPELVIRTSGEQRLSNFLLWQSAYAELYFCDRLWPDFTTDDFDDAMRNYAERQRRFGGR
jgi:undecaprenyl diphosphate synthase